MVASNTQHIQRRQTVVVVLAADLGSSKCQALEEEFGNLQDGLRSGAVRNIVIDCSATESLGCSALGLLLRLWKSANSYDGGFALCGLSPIALEILRVVQLNRLWPIYGTRLEAIHAVEQGNWNRTVKKPTPA